VRLRAAREAGSVNADMACGSPFQGRVDHWRAARLRVVVAVVGAFAAGIGSVLGQAWNEQDSENLQVIADAVRPQQTSEWLGSYAVNLTNDPFVLASELRTLTYQVYLARCGIWWLAGSLIAVGAIFIVKK